MNRLQMTQPGFIFQRQYKYFGVYSLVGGVSRHHEDHFLQQRIPYFTVSQLYTFSVSFRVGVGSLRKSRISKRSLDEAQESHGSILPRIRSGVSTIGPCVNANASPESTIATSF